MKRGFTLIELILVLLLLSIIALISIPIVTGIITDSKEKTYQQQIANIETAARTYMTRNPNKLPAEDELGSSCISITDMQKSGILESKDIINPKYSENCEEQLEADKAKEWDKTDCSKNPTSSQCVALDKKYEGKMEQCRNEHLIGVVMVTWDSDNNKYKYTYDSTKEVCPN